VAVGFLKSLTSDAYVRASKDNPRQKYLEKEGTTLPEETGIPSVIFQKRNG